MSGIPIHLHGNVVRDPELRVTARGDHVVNLTVACNPSHYDKASGRWVDDPPSFFHVSCWHALADNVHTSVGKGDPVLVSGVLKQRKHVARTAREHRDDEARPQYTRSLEGHSAAVESCSIRVLIARCERIIRACHESISPLPVRRRGLLPAELPVADPDLV